MDNPEFIVERGIPIGSRARKDRPGKWKDLALTMGDPETDGEGNWIYDSVAHTKDGQTLNQKQAISLTNALNRLGRKGTTRKVEDEPGYRVWRIQ